MTDPLPPALRDKLSRRTALIVVDMQNDFCADGGYVSRLGRDPAACRAIVPALGELIAAARSAGIPVLWLVADYDPQTVPAAMRARQAEMGMTDICCARGSWGAAPFGVVPAAGEPVIVKHCYSGFIGTDLRDRLEALGVETLVFTGVQTNVCVESTLRDAHSLGYYPVVVDDCVASHMPAQHEATLANVRFLLGYVAESAALKREWQAGAPAARSAGP